VRVRAAGRISDELYAGEFSLPTEIPEEVRKKAVELARSLVNPNVATSE
jgi:hypothetical protein